MFCPLDNTSLGRCVPWTMCPLEEASLRRCVPWTMGPFDYESLGRSAAQSTRPLNVMFLTFFDKTEAVKRLDQDQPNLEVPRLTCPNRESTHPKYQALASLGVWITLGPPLWRDYEVLLHPNLEVPRLTCPGRESNAPWISGTCKPGCLNHVRFTTMKRLDQVLLHLNLEV